MGFKRYLRWHDAIYGHTGYRLDINHGISSNCALASDFNLRKMITNHVMLTVNRVTTAFL